MVPNAPVMEVRNFGLGLRRLVGGRNESVNGGPVIENGTDESSVKRKENFSVTAV